MRRRSHRGFTLLEITITLAILGIVMTIVFGVFAQTIAGKERAETRGDELASARAALARITSDLTSVRIRRAKNPTAANAAAATPTPSRTMEPEAIRPEDGLFLGRVRSERGVAVDDVAFSTLVRRPTAITYAASDLAIVHYFVDVTSEDPKRRGLYREALYSLAGQAFDPDRPDVQASVLLLPGVAELDLRYFDGKDWVDGWDSTDNRNFAPAPYAVRVRMTVVNERGEADAYETAVDLPTMRNLKAPQAAAPRP